MEIAVCIKQVPNTMNISIDPKNGTLIREGVSVITNPFDLVAVETALRIREINGEGRVTAISMGPKSAEESLRESFAMGVDRGILLSHRRFSGADVLATSYTLSLGIKKIPYDLIICGKQTIDGDTAQVGQSIGEHLGLSHVYNVKEILRVEEGKIQLLQGIDDGELLLEIETPCVLIMNKGAYSPRLPTLKLKLSAKKKEIEILGEEDFEEHELEGVGIAGSPTKVIKSYVALNNKKRDKKLYAGDLEEVTDTLFKNLRNLPFLQEVIE